MIDVALASARVQECLTYVIASATAAGPVGPPGATVGISGSSCALIDCSAAC